MDAARFGLLRQPRPLYEQLAELIRQKVAAGELGPGERLPGELELSSSLGVSRP
ncbi:MAG: GntR family transcriptional regulator, partial [Bacillota bacterium]